MPTDPWDLLEAALAHPPAMAWSDPARGIGFIAQGARALYNGTGGFGEATQWCSDALERYPLVVGGFPFALREAARDQAWERPCLWAPEHVHTIDNIHKIDCSVSRGDAPQGQIWSPDPVPAHYIAAVHEALTQIRGGSLDKVVLARSAALRLSGGARADAAGMVRSLRAAFPRAVTYAVALGPGEVLCGATPEMLASVRGRDLWTQAVAGTGSVDTLHESVKDAREHALVVEDIVDALAPLCGGVERGATSVVPSGELAHLVTPLRATLPPGAGVLDVVARLHPTAALCGTPRQSAREFLERHEALERGWYGGPIGWLGRGGDGDFAVAIRCARIRSTGIGDEVRAYAGAGIVARSVPEAELAETAAKMRAAQACVRLHGQRVEGGMA